MRTLGLLAALPLLTAIGGCATTRYYGQAVSGQWEIIAKTRPIEEMLHDPATPPPLAEKLKRSQLIRDFASRELALPDNPSYRHYADLGRSYVVWNVVATPEFSLAPIVECFPIAGCLTYRGFFNEPEARQRAAILREQGNDVFVYGVPAYSTLGWLADPLLNTIIQYSEIELAKLVFHELAHQLLYVKDDSGFNEAFATAVELEGVQRWIAQQGNPQQKAELLRNSQRADAFHQMLAVTRDQLANLYVQEMPAEVMRLKKQAIFTELLTRYGTFRQQWNSVKGYDHWFQPIPGNAHLATLSTYHALVPAFQKLLADSGGHLPTFYLRAQALGALQKPERDVQLERLLTTTQ